MKKISKERIISDSVESISSLNLLNGLNREEVLLRQKQGLDNKEQREKTKSLWHIILDHTLTGFNALNVVLACLILLAALGDVSYYRNLLFMGAVIINTLIGVVQEYRSRKAVEELSLMTQPQAVVIREGKQQTIAVADIVLDDILYVKVGQQIPVDAKVIASDGLTVDESMLTGESDAINKEVDATILSGSFVLAGAGTVQVTAVGEKTYATKLTAEARKIKKHTSQIKKSLALIIRYMSVVLLVIGVSLLVSKLWLRPTGDWRAVLVSTTAALVGMIPEGLVLLTSVAFAVGVYHLAKKQTLVNSLNCIETLARIDLLCLDKTGTITTGEMQVENFVLIEHGNQASATFWLDLLRYMYTALPEKNATAKAILDYTNSANEIDLQEWGEIIQKIPFSSARKWSAISLANKTDKQKCLSVYVGALDVLADKEFIKEHSSINEQLRSGLRLVGVAYSNSNLSEELPSDLQLVGWLAISDKLQTNIAKMLDYFRRQEVNFKIISGDNPITVQAIAKRAGLEDLGEVLDLSQVEEKIWQTPEMLAELAEQYSVFGRVTPFQKKALVQALQSRGHLVAMTGDGVNDVPALKQADIGVGMAVGAEVVRGVADLVLANNDMQGLINAVKEGRRVINNIERVAILFLNKTVYSVLLALSYVFLSARFPIYPIQFTLISSLTIGMPAFFLALKPNYRLVKGKFLPKVLKRSIPSGITIFFLVMVQQLLKSWIGLNNEEMATLTVHIILGCGLILLYRSCKPFDLYNAIIYACSLGLAVIACVFMRNFFLFAPLQGFVTLLILLFCLASYPLMRLMEYFYDRMIKHWQIQIVDYNNQH